MPLYYRIQPAGLGLNHLSHASDGSQTGLHVFQYGWETYCTDVHREMYGDEIVVIEAPEHEDHGDVEGVQIDPRLARIVRRFSADEWDSLVSDATGVPVDDLRDEIDGLTHDDAIEDAVARACGLDNRD